MTAPPEDRTRPAVTSDGGGHPAPGLREARAILSRVRDLAESWTEADGWGAPTREMLAEADCGRELLGLLDGGCGEVPAPAVPATGYLTPAQAVAVLGVKPGSLRYLEREGALTAVRTPGGTRRYPAAGVRALRAEMDAAGGALNYTEVAAMFNVSTVTVNRWVAAGRLVPVRVPGKRRRGIRPQDVAALLRGEEPEAARKLGIEQRDRIAGEAHGG